MMPGAFKLTKHLYENNIPMAIVTNGHMQELQFALDHTIGLEQGIFSHFICGADDQELRNNKPGPDIYLVCAKRFNPFPNQLFRLRGLHSRHFLCGLNCT